jgi:predicted amidohydrolase
MRQDDILRVTLVQYDIAWEDKQKNLNRIDSIVAELAGQTDVVVLPEMFSTGFTMNSRNLAEPADGKTIGRVKEWAAKSDVAVCGSYIAVEEGNYYNRGFFITSNEEYFYDKRHLFRMGSEPESFSAGKSRLIFEHKGFRICLLICYDLRFPVWARSVNNEYDLLIYTANWPASRIKAWETLLAARAIENVSYVCGVNRVGTDGNGLVHNGCSKLINARGEEISNIGISREQTETVSISKTELETFRAKFPVWKDADEFKIY